jgi:hypothetical protein
MVHSGPKRGTMSDRLADGRDFARLTGALIVAVGVAAVVGSAVGGTAATGGVSTNDTAQPGDDVIENGDTYFLGQVLFTDAFESDDSVTLRTADGEFVSQVVPEDDGGVLLRTERFGTGKFRLVDDEDTSIVFEVEEQFFTVETNDPTVLNGGSTTTLSLSVESNRAAYRTAVSAEGLSRSQLQSVFDEAVVNDADGDGSAEVVLPDGRPEQTLTADFEGTPPGEYTLTFSVVDTPARSTVSVEVRLHPDGEATLAAADSPVRVQQAANQPVRGTSTLPDGTRLQIVAENVSERPFRITKQTTVQNGEFLATLDFSGVAVGQRFTLAVEQGPVTRDAVEGVVVRRAGVSETASATPGAVTIDSVVLPDGGFVTVSTVERERLGTSELLAPGEHENVSVELSRSLSAGDRELLVGLRRDDGDGSLTAADPPYRLQGAPVTQILSVTVTTTTTTTTTATTATTTTTTTTTATPTTTTTATTATTTADGAGVAGLGVGAALLGIGVVVGFVAAVLGAGRDVGEDSADGDAPDDAEL